MTEHEKTWNMQNAEMPESRRAQEGRSLPREATTELDRIPARQERSLAAPLTLLLLQ